MFALTWHVLGDSDAAVALLTAAGAYGAVLSTDTPLTCVVVRGGDEKRLVAANTGILVRCDVGGDEGAGFRLAEGSKQVGELAWWGPGKERGEVGPWVSRGVLSFANASRLRELLAHPPSEAVIYEAGTLLGLRHFLNLGPTDYALPDQIESVHDGVLWVPERPEASDPDAAMMRSMGLDPDAFD
jgi:hypothetical protein